VAMLVRSILAARARKGWVGGRLDDEITLMETDPAVQRWEVAAEGKTGTILAWDKALAENGNAAQAQVRCVDGWTP
jgi:hypothetical protein